MNWLMAIICIFATQGFAQYNRIDTLKKKKPPPAPIKYATAPTAVLTATTTEWKFPAGADSNSPVIWDNEKIVAFNSAGHPWRSEGENLFSLGEAEQVSFNNASNGGRWMEAIIKDDRGILYGFYHNEPHLNPIDQAPIFGVCGLLEDKTIPQIGMARSTNGGKYWEDLGVVLQANKALFEMDCLRSKNHYFAGGHGDFSVILKEDSDEVFIYFTNYTGTTEDQGVAVAWMPWSKRDRPQGQFHKYFLNTWDKENGMGGYASPINSEFANKISWHEEVTDAFWGPSIHYNSYLNMYVMFLNHAIHSGPSWKQEGLYVSFSPGIENPAAWSKPVKIFEEGSWYPQIVGIEPGVGTDKLAGQKAYFFMSGKYMGDVTFYKPGDVLP